MTKMKRRVGRRNRAKILNPSNGLKLGLKGLLEAGNGGTHCPSRADRELLKIMTASVLDC